MDLEQIRKKRQQQQREKALAAQVAAAEAQTAALKAAIETNAAVAAQSSARTTTAVKENTSAMADRLKTTSDNIVSMMSNKDASTAEALNNLVVATIMARDPQLVKVVSEFTTLMNKLAAANDRLANSPINDLPTVNQQLLKALQDFNKQGAKAPDYTAKFDALEKTLKSLDMQPVVNLPKQKTEIDIKPITAALDNVRAAVEANRIEVPAVELDEVVSGLQAVQNTIANLSFPVPNYVFPFVDTAGKASQAPLPFLSSAYDYIAASFPDAVTEVYTFKKGGASGTTVQTVTVVYTDSTKASLSSVTRT
jgi:hypothetical protein